MQSTLPLACFLSMIRPPGIQFENSLLQIAPVDKVKCPFMRDGNDVGFRLYTRHNPTVYEELAVNDDEKLFASNMNFHDPTVIYFHAFMEQPDDGSAVMVREAYVLRGDTNVIMVDASRLEAGPWYFTAADNTWFIGRFAAQFIDYLASRGLDLSKTHLVGHSLGAQAAGVAGAALHSGRVARITGLDPALPLFSKLPLEQKLDASDAEFVDVIHTDAGIFGVNEPVGHADFYPNGGISPQPGCELEVVIPQHMLLNKCENIKHKLGFYTFYLKTNKQFLKPQTVKHDFEKNLKKFFNFVQHTKIATHKNDKHKTGLFKYNNIKASENDRKGMINNEFINDHDQGNKDYIKIATNSGMDSTKKGIINREHFNDQIEPYQDQIMIESDQNVRVQMVVPEDYGIEDSDAILKREYKMLNTNSQHIPTVQHGEDREGFNNANGNQTKIVENYDQPIETTLKYVENINNYDQPLYPTLTLLSQKSIFNIDLKESKHSATLENNQAQPEQKLDTVNNDATDQTPLEDTSENQAVINCQDTFNDNQELLESSPIKNQEQQILQSKPSTVIAFETIRHQARFDSNLNQNPDQTYPSTFNNQDKAQIATNEKQPSSIETTDQALQNDNRPLQPLTTNDKSFKNQPVVKSHVVKRQKRFIPFLKRSESTDNDNFLFRMLEFLLKHRRSVIPVFTVMREINTLVKSANGELNHITKERNNYIGAPPPVQAPVSYSLELSNEPKAVAFAKRLLGLKTGERLTISGQ